MSNFLCKAILSSMLLAAVAQAAMTRQYFAYRGVEDKQGIIAPWYNGQNGQCDWRVRIAAETLKRYPWAEPPLAVMPAPHYVFNGHWAIKPDGTIVVDPQLPDWHNGDVGQRSVSLILGLSAYYRYSGDAGVIGPITRVADYLLDFCQTPVDHPWPLFPISAPTKGKAYGQADPHGFIQLDLSAQLGSAMIVAYKLTGVPRYREAVLHWADLLAEHCKPQSGVSPWNRYANPQDNKWDTRQTAGVSLILQFLDDVVRLGYTGQNSSIVAARDAGDVYLRDVLLNQWSNDPTFGHHFWDWLNPVATCAVPCYTAQYLMNRPQAFPQWQTDIRNMISLFFCRASVNPASAGDVYSGAWAFPEASNCCGKSLQYPVMSIAATLARFGVQADNPWAREIARRQTILCTYDAHETGVVEDGIDGGPIVAGDWFNLAHPWPLRQVMEFLAWQPEQCGAGCENHIMRSSSVVNQVQYGQGRIRYSTYDAPVLCQEVLRLAFSPRVVSADGKLLTKSAELNENGYTVTRLAEGDYIITVRHDGCRDVTIEGDDPQQMIEDTRLEYTGAWQIKAEANASSGELHAASQANARVTFAFKGNQVRLLGRVAPDGGNADVYLDGVKQLCGIDFWCPQVRDQQVLCYKNGLPNGRHTLEIVALGANNPLATGSHVYIDAVQWSAAKTGKRATPDGGPSACQRVVFGYVNRTDYMDSQGNSWRPATEFIYRIKATADLVPAAFWTTPRATTIAGTADPELYRYGVHGPDFTAYFTVEPKQNYNVTLKFCQTGQPERAGGYATSVDIQGQRVISDMDIAASAGGLAKAVDLTFTNIKSEHGVISIRFTNRDSAHAMIQAIQVATGKGHAKTAYARFPFVAEGK